MRVPFQIISNRKNLLGVFHIAKQQLDIPVVIIMCYGLNGSRVEQHRMSVNLGELCENSNINLVRFDFTNVGISEGEFFFSSIHERIKNVISIYEYIKGCFNSKISVYLIGFSDGAKIAIQSKEFIRDLEGIVFWNPIINISSETSSHSTETTIKEKFKLHKKYNKPYKQLFGVCLNIGMVKELNNDNSVRKINDDIRKLFIFGEKDKFTKDIKRWVEENNYLNSDIKIIKNSGHLFGDSMLEQEVNGETIEWIKEKMN